MKQGFSFLAFLCLAVCTHSQQLTPSVLAADGGISKTDKISLEWTLGEFAVETITTTKNLYTQGFHQPVLMVKSFYSPPKTESSVDILSGYKVLLAPNPVKSFVNVSVSAKGNEKFILALYDMSGKRIQSKQVNGTDFSVRIEMGHLASGVYLMNVRNETGITIRDFIIVKAE